MAFGHKFYKGETGENEGDSYIAQLFNRIIDARPSVENPILVTVTTEMVRTMNIDVIAVNMHRGEPDYLLDLHGARYDRYLFNNILDASVSGRRLRFD